MNHQMPTLSTSHGRLVVRNTGLSLAELRASYSHTYDWLTTTTGDLPQSMVERPALPTSVIRRARREVTYNPSQAAEQATHDAINQRAHARFYSRLEAR